MVRGCSAAVGNFTEVIHQPRRGQRKDARVWNSFLSPHLSIALYKKHRKEKQNVKKLRSYSSIWKVEQVYSFTR